MRSVMEQLKVFLFDVCIKKRENKKTKTNRKGNRND